MFGFKKQHNKTREKSNNGFIHVGMELNIMSMNMSSICDRVKI